MDLSFNSYKRNIYDNQNTNKIFNPNSMQQNFNFPMQQDDIMNSKKMRKNNQNNSSLEQGNNINNNSMNFGNGMIKMNYNSGKNNLMKNNQNNNMPLKINNNLSLSSNAAKNKIPNLNSGDNLNLLASQGQNMHPMLNMNFNNINGPNFYMQPNMINPHMNQGYINNNHMTIGNNNINNKDLGFNNGNNNKAKYMRYNLNTNPNPKYMNNSIDNNPMFIKNKDNNNINNPNDMNNNNLAKNFTLKTPNDMNNYNKSNLNMGNLNQLKQYILCLNIKIDSDTTKQIVIKSLNECPSILDSLKDGNKGMNEKVKKLIQEKINKSYEILRKIYEFGIKNYTYKNLCEIHHQMNYEKGKYRRKNENKEKVFILKKNKSFQDINKFFESEKKLVLENVRNVGALNISF